MVMHWGSWTSGYSNNFRVGIDLTVSGTTISALYRIEAQYVANDSMTITRTGAITGSTTFTYNQNGGTRNINTRTRSGTRGTSYTFGARMSGIYNGAAPTISGASIRVPAAVPSRPGTPSVSDIKSNGWKATVSAPSSNGASITQYQWQRSTTSNFSSGVSSSTTTGRTQTWTTASANTQYWVRVRARNSAGWSTYSPNRAVKTTPLSPNTPSQVSVSRSSDTRQNVSWSRNQTTARPYTSQQVRRRDNVSTSWTTVGNVSGTATSYQDNNTRSNRRYEYSVRATNSAGSSSWSSSAVVTTTPAAPTGVSASRSESDVVVRWTRQTTHASTGDQQIQDNPGGTGWVLVGSVSRTATSWTHPSPNPEVTHQYRVRASSTTPTLWSGYTTSGVVQLTAPPNAPTIIGPSVSDAYSDVRLEWRHNPIDSSVQTSAEIRWRPLGGSWSTISVGSSSDQHYTVSSGELGWENGENIEWQVRTWGAHSTASPWSATSLLVLSGPPITGIVSPEDGSLFFSPELLVEWSYFDPEETAQSGWEVILIDENNDTVEEKSGSGSRSSIVLDTVLSDGTSWEVRVRTRDGQSMWSEWDSSSFSAQFPSPTPPELSLEWQETTGSIAIEVDNPDPATTEFERRNLVSNPRGDMTGSPITVSENLNPNPRGRNSVNDVAVHENLITNPRGRNTDGTVVIQENLILSPLLTNSSAWAMTRLSLSHSGGWGQLTTTEEGTAFLSTRDLGSHLPFSGLGSEAEISLDVRVPPGQDPVDVDVRVFIYDSSGTEVDSSYRQTIADRQSVRSSDGVVNISGSISTYSSNYYGRLLVYIRDQNGSYTVGNVLEVRNIYFGHSGPYFDGDTWNGDPDFTPEWTGTPHNSTSRLVAPAPVGWLPGGTNNSDYISVYYSETRDCLAYRYKATPPSVMNVRPPVSGLAGDGDATGLLEVIHNTGPELRTSPLVTGASLPIFFIPLGQSTHRFEFPRPSNSQVYLLRTGAGVGEPGQTVYFRMLIALEGYDGEWFDADSPVEDSDLHAVWDGDEHSSVSLLMAPSVSGSHSTNNARYYYSQSRDAIAVRATGSGATLTRTLGDNTGVRTSILDLVDMVTDGPRDMRTRWDPGVPDTTVENTPTVLRSVEDPSIHSGLRILAVSDSKPGDTFYFRSFAANGAYYGPYFDGDSVEDASEDSSEFNIFDPDLTLEWTGEPHESTSRLFVPERVNDWRAPSQTLGPIYSRDSVDDSHAIRVIFSPSRNAPSSVYIDPSQNFPVSEGDRVRVSVDVKAHTQEMADSMRLRVAPYNGAVLSDSTSLDHRAPVLLNEWTTLHHEIRIASSPPDGYVRALVWPTANSHPNSSFSVRRMIVEIGQTLPTNTNYFDGASTDRSTATGHQAIFTWEGTPHASPSHGLYFPAESAEYNDIYRSVNSGPWERIATDVPVNSSFVDTTNPVIGDICYRASAWTSLPSMTTGPSECILIHNGSVRHPPNEPASQSAWLSGGDGMAVVCRAHCDIDIEEEIGPSDLTLHRFSGRRYPQLYSGIGQSQEIKLTFTTRASDNWHQGAEVSSYEDWKRLLASPGPHLYRDFQGRKFYVAVSPLSASRFFSDVMACSITLTRIGE